jgi:hypothetical protein
MIATKNKGIQKDLHSSRDVEVCAEIEVFDVFNLTPQELAELYNKCLAFSYDITFDDIYTENGFNTCDPKYPLSKLRRTKIKLLKLKKDMSVFAIKALAEASFGDLKKLENIFDSDPLLHSANFILASKNRRFIFANRHNDLAPRDKREIIESDSYSRGHYPVLFMTSRPADEIIKEGCHIAWI